MKKLLSFILILALCASVFCFPASAISDGDWEFNLKNGEAHITKYIGAGGDVVVPEKLKGATVTRICFGAFTNNKNAETIRVPGTVKLIEWMAFQGCVAKEIYIEDGVEQIDAMCFRLNDSLETVRLPGTVKKMDYELFSSCDNLTNVILEEGIPYIAKEMFESCTSLKNITIPSSVTYIENDAFYYCTALESITIPAKVTQIGSGVFCGCKALKEVKFAGASLTTIGDYPFRDCDSLENIILPVSVKKIGSHVFWYCDNLKGAVIPYGVQTMGNNMFGDCPKVEWISIPSTVKSIGADLIGGGPETIVYVPAGSAAEKACQNLNWNTSYLLDASADSQIQMLYNGIRISFGEYGQNPCIVDNRTLVPLRSVFNAMGAEIEWDAATRTAYATRGDVSVSITIGSNQLFVNGTAVALDVPAIIINDRTMVPARAVSEAFGATVGWDAAGRTVIINE